jgi:enterochelin esterase-like enzyme
VGVVGLGVAAGLAGPRALHRLTQGDCGEQGTRPPESGIRVRYETIRSAFVPEPVEIAIAQAPGEPRGQPSPVCFCLPGRGGAGRDVMGVLRMHDFMAQAVAERGAAPFALVGVDGGDSYWHRRAGGEDRMAMLVQEVIPRVAERHRLGAGGAPRAVMGWSMGGYGALRAAQRDAGAFRAVVAVSPALWTTYADAVADAFDGPQDYAGNDVFDAVDRLRGTKVRVDCGSRDPFVDATRALIERLPEPPSGGISEGCHDPGYWLRVAPGQVDFLGRALA